MTQSDSRSFDEVKKRLDQIVEAVSDDSIPLDDALKLYEEAVQLGLAASTLLEENIAENNALYDEEQNADDVVLDGEIITEEEVVGDDAVQAVELTDLEDQDQEGVLG